MKDLVVATIELSQKDLAWFGAADAVTNSNEGLLLPEEVATAFLGKSRLRSVEVECRWLKSDTSRFPVQIQTEVSQIVSVARRARLRPLAGALSEDPFYHTLRPGDVLVLVFDRSSSTLSFHAVRHGLFKGRDIPDREALTYRQFGQASGVLPNTPQTAELLQLLGLTFPGEAHLLHLNDYAIQGIWLAYAKAGFTPLAAAEQIAFLLYLRWIDESGKVHPKSFDFDATGTGVYRWERMKSYMNAPDVLTDIRDGLLKTDQFHGDAWKAGMANATLSFHSRELLEEAVAWISAMDLSEGRTEGAGSAMESLLARLAAGPNGQYPTPPHIAKVMVQLARPTLNEVVCDPAAGTGGLLLWARQVAVGGLMFLPELSPSLQWEGYDLDATMVRLGLINLALHGIPKPQLFLRDSLAADLAPQKISVILTDLTWSVSVQPQADHPLAGPDLLPIRSDALLLLNSLRWLEPAGRLVVAVPESLLYDSSEACQKLRRLIVERYGLQAVVTLPAGSFLPYTPVRTALLVIRAGRHDRKSAWFYRVSGDGYTPDAARTPAPERDDLQYVVAAFRQTMDAEYRYTLTDAEQAAVASRAWTVTHDEIAKSDYSLAPDRYQPVIQSDSALAEPIRLVEQMLDTERQIQTHLTQLHRLLQEAVDHE